jgi:hypothetical protein
MVSSVPAYRLPIAQQERLLYIDLRARFLGEIRRQHLLTRFNIETAAATRDLAYYRDECPDNLLYEPATKTYVRSQGFRPMYANATSEDVLAWLCPGRGQSGLLDQEVRLPMQRLGGSRSVPVSVLEVICPALAGAGAIEITYSSPHEGTTVRKVAPHDIADVCGTRLLRAFDYDRRSFSNIELEWIVDAKPVHRPGGHADHQVDDKTWTTEINLELVPHPENVKFPDALAESHGLKDGVWRTTVRVPLVPIWSDRVGVDMTKKHRQRGQRFLWWARNSSFN